MRVAARCVLESKAAWRGRPHAIPPCHLLKETGQLTIDEPVKNQHSIKSIKSKLGPDWPKHFFFFGGGRGLTMSQNSKRTGLDRIHLHFIDILSH